MRKQRTAQADVIRSARLRKGYTQQEASEKAGISLRIYQRLESGEREIRNAAMRTGIGLCAALDLDPVELTLTVNRQAES